MSRLARIFLLLLAANLLLALWFVIRSDARPDARVTDSFPSDVASLMLARESGAPPLRPVEQVPVADELVVQPSACYLLGDFATEADARAAMEGSEQSYRLVGVQVPVEGSSRYRVRSEIAPDRDAANLRLTQLREVITKAGARIDSYLVTTGPIANSVSLGLFGSQANALNVQRILAEQGEEVIVELENQLENRYQLVFSDDYHVENNREKWILAGLEIRVSDVSQNLCETIAQPE